MSSPNVSAGLANAELFRDLTPAELERIERVAHRRHYDPGAVIVREGQGGIAFFIVTDPPTSPVKYADQIVCGLLVAVVILVSSAVTTSR